MVKKLIYKETKDPTTKDYETIIKIQEQIIQMKEQESICFWKIFNNQFDELDKYKQWHNKNWFTIDELNRELELAYKKYFEVVRAYNAIFELGKVAEELGIDIKNHVSELPENKYKDLKFSIENKVLESGKVKTIYRATKKKKDKK